MERLKSRTPLKRSLWVVGAYVIVAGLWIMFSDALVAQWFQDPEALSAAQTYKGVLFVLVTGLVLFGLIYRQLSHDRTLLALHNKQRNEIVRLNEFLDTVIQKANIWINVLDTNGQIILWNKTAEEISGYSREEVMHSDDVWPLMYPDDAVREDIMETVARLLRDEESLAGFETSILSKRGDYRTISWYTTNLHGPDGEVTGTIAIGQDVTDIRQAEEQIRRQDRQLVTLMDNLPGMAYRCLYDEHWTMKFVSSGCIDLTGYEAEELLDNCVASYASLIDGEENDRLMNQVETAIGNAEPFSLEYALQRKDGQKVWVWERGRAVVENDELVLEGIIMDVSDRKELEDELAQRATHDALTGLLDRREASRLLEEEIVRARRYGRSLALLWIDLDHFKQINDQLGHAAGDTVLKGFSQLLASRVRQVDIVSRFGGEEFVVVMPEMQADEARQSADRLRELVAQTPQTLKDGESVHLTISVGVGIFPECADDASSLLAAADKAMYQAKADGRNRVVVASPAEAPNTSLKHEG